jgi:hypothetical protein
MNWQGKRGMKRDEEGVESLRRTPGLENDVMVGGGGHYDSISVSCLETNWDTSRFIHWTTEGSD